jgi:hypothetical protein
MKAIKGILFVFQFSSQGLGNRGQMSENDIKNHLHLHFPPREKSSKRK